MYQSKCVIELRLIEDIKKEQAKQAELSEVHLLEINDLESKISAHDAIVDKQKAWIQDRDNNIQSLTLEVVNLKESVETEKRQKDTAYRRRAELEENVQELKNELIKQQ